MFSIQGKTAFITGAAGGIGLAVAIRFIEAGAKVLWMQLGITHEEAARKAAEDEAAQKAAEEAVKATSKTTVTKRIAKKANVPTVPGSAKALSDPNKVREMFDLGEHLLMVATDRISAFDVVMPNGIPRKGEVLTQIT